MNSKQWVRLKNYSAFSASFLCLAGNADSQIIYHDIDPDQQVFLDEYQLDFDHDGNVDFKFIFNIDTNPGYLPDETRIRINPLGSNRVAFELQTIPVTYSGMPSATYTSGATQLYFSVAPVLNEGETIGAGMNFQSDIANLYEKLFFYVYSSYNFETFLPGEWMGQENKFAALQFNIDGEYHYGWVRLSLNDTLGITVHDFAYEANPDTPILTKIVDYSPSWIFVNDAGTAGTGDDLHFSFSAPGDEEDILAYRVVCVKQGMAENFSVADAEILSPDQFVEITPDGSAEYTSNFISTSRDSEGDLITTGQSYKLIVLNVMQPVSGFADMLSIPSSSVKLIDTVATISGMELGDISNFGNGTDLEVTFDTADPVQGISEYRIIIAKRDSADTFTLEKAEVLSSDRYTIATPGINHYEIYLDAAMLDSDGDLIEPGKYKSFVLSIADGSTANVNALSEPSASVTLETATSVVDPILLEDVDEFGDGRDLRISFAAAPLEQTIDEYRVYIANVTDAFDFDLGTALAVDPENYFSITPSGTDVVITGDSLTTDVSGNFVSWGVPYYAYVVSMATQYGLTDTLAARSNEVIINHPYPEVNISDAEQNEITVYSSGNQVTVNMQDPLSDGMKLQITNSEGQLVFSAPVRGQNQTFSFDLPAGVYIASVSSGEKILTRKLIIHQ